MSNRLDLADVAGQARAGWRLGAALCRDCGGYHQTWGILRAAGIVGGTAIDRDRLAPTLAELIAPGQRILIAGAADAGLVRLVVEATTARPITLVVADRCPAPLALVAALAAIPGVTIETRQACLTDFTDAAGFDLIVSHSMLPFLDLAGRLSVLERLHAALAPGGRLLLTLRTAPHTTQDERAAHRAVWLARAQDKLAHVPELVAFAGADLAPRLADYAEGHRTRLDGFTDPAAVIDLLECSGFRLDWHREGDDSTALRHAGRVVTKRSHSFLAARR